MDMLNPECAEEFRPSACPHVRLSVCLCPIIFLVSLSPSALYSLSLSLSSLVFCCCHPSIFELDNGVRAFLISSASI
eukprot:m.86573 g.86573  ORF g.86573 m.86573 type:complete len:77 (+) comp14473_c3_seq2:202-432(+)